MADRIGKLCQGLLPAEFENNRRQLPAIQHFLETHLPEPLDTAVTLLRVDDSEIVIAATSPPMANYLRLYCREIEKQLQEAFDRRWKLKVRSLPASSTRLTPAVDRPPAPRTVSDESIEAIERSARCIDDEDLRASMLSLAKSMRQDRR